MSLSPNLLAIQSLTGEVPGDKYKELHSIANQIIENEKEYADFVDSGITLRVQPALHSRVRILIGIKLKLNAIIIEALKSDDVTIVKQALNAKWFFNPSNPVINVNYFTENIMPYISVRTRLELIKKLASCLMTESEKANKFFSAFTDMYGLQQSLPLLVACSEQYIFDTVLKRRIILPSRILGFLYARYPQLVIRYLHLENSRREESECERKINIKAITKNYTTLQHYISFLPKLVKHHTGEFIKLYESLPTHYRTIKLGSTRAEFFLKNAVDIVVKKPKIFLKLLPLKLVSNRLSMQQFELMFSNLFADDESDFYLQTMMDYLKYYPEEKKLNLLIDKYNLKYNKDLLESSKIYVPWFYKLLPADLKEKYGKKFFQNNSQSVERMSYLPPNESIPMLKEEITKPSSIPRFTWISSMISSCSIYDSKEDLLEVLRYYNTRHKNEQAIVFHQVIDSLTKKFDIKSLHKDHWQIIKEIIHRAFVKGHLFTLPNFIFTSLFQDALHYYLQQYKVDTTDCESKEFLDLLIEIIVECYVEHNMIWDFITKYPETNKYCLQKFLMAIPQKYPLTHSVWVDFRELSIALDLIKAMNKFNLKNVDCRRKKKGNTEIGTTELCEKRQESQMQFTITDYPWLMQLAKNTLKKKITEPKYDRSRKPQKFREELRKLDYEFYQKVIDENPDLINDLDSNDALLLLKCDYTKVYAKWLLYLTNCKEKLQLNNKIAKSFVTKTKWYQHIPIKFMEQCLLETDEKGSILTLGILLEGTTFGHIIEPYLPNEATLNVNDKSAKKSYSIVATLPKAMNCANPPVPLDTIAKLCQGDYVSLAAQTLANVAQRIPADRVLIFANQLVKKHISVKKLGIRLVFQVSTNMESKKFLTQIWQSENNPSIREVVASMIFDVFKQSPSDETWGLIKLCVEELTNKDMTVLELLTDFEGVNKNFVTPYIQTLLNKIEQFSENDLGENKKAELILSLGKHIDQRVMQLLPEELINNILRKRFFDYPVEFLLDIYLFSDTGKFNERFNTFIDILQDRIKHFNESDPNIPRFFPANNQVQKFMSDVIQQMWTYDKSEMLLQFINKLLGVLTATVPQWQLPTIIIHLMIYNDYIDAACLKEFGKKCGLKIAFLIKEFKSDIVVIDIVECIKQFLRNSKINKGIQKHDLILTVMEGLMESDERIGALACIRLVNPFLIAKFDGRFDSFIQTWRRIEDQTVQFALNEMLNTLDKCHAELK